MKNKLAQYGEVLEHVSLKQYNTFRIGGLCKYMVFPSNKEDLKNLVILLQQEAVSYFVLGNGSNVILSDDYYDGVIIVLKKMDSFEIKENQVLVGAGIMMPKLAMETINHNLAGFEWAVGIPGTVGGCIYGNAEAYKESTFDYLETVTVLNPQNEIEVLKKSDLSYGYRTSYFKTHPGYIILEAVFSLSNGNKLESMEKVMKRKEKRKMSQPLEYPSAGSVFRNPSSENPSGKIIEELGLKGCRIGGAEVSQKHANFIINTGSSTGKDVRDLVELVHAKVKEATGIDLVMEQEYVGWDLYEREKNKNKT